MKIAYAGFDLMEPALRALSQENEIVKLFTCRVDGEYETNDGVIALARSLGAPFTLNRITREDVDALLDGGCELLISAGYYYRIPVDCRLPMVNVHPSLLPYGRGTWPTPWAILDRLSESGVTVHKTEESFDTGDILLQRRFALAPDENLESLTAKANALLPAMMHELTQDFDRLWAQAQPQGEGVYQPEPDPEDYVLSRCSTVAYADRVLRAFYGYHACYRNNGQITRIIRGRAAQGDPAGRRYPLADGYIVDIDEKIGQKKKNK